MSYGKCFSENLRKIRLSKGLTQKDLANMTKYSEKTVSKWETSRCNPTVDGIFAIAEALHIDIKELFASNKPEYFLGIDGGGTKTDFALSDFNGSILNSITLSGCNPNDIGLKSSEKILKDGIYEICKGINLSSVQMFAGIAGGSSQGFRSDFLNFFKQFGFFDFDCDSDNENIISAALGKESGITVIMGTGFCVYVADKKERKRYAGYGYFFDEGGSGFNIGRSALSSYFYQKDGILKKTPLTDKIQECANKIGVGFLTHLYKGGKKEIASYAKLVFEAAEEGDELAIKIIDENIKYAEIAIKKAISTFENKIPKVALAGGITKNQIVFEKLKNDLHDICNLFILESKPVIGAVLKAIDNFNDKEEIRNA